MSRTAVLIVDSADVDRFQLEMDAGKMPHLASFLAEAAFTPTRNVVSHRSEMAWAQFLGGGPAEEIGWYGWWNFHPDRYETVGSGFPPVRPFYADDPVESVIADVIQSHAVPEVPGSQVFAYGAHSPQFPRSSVPAGLITEAIARVGHQRTFNNDHSLGWFDRRYVEGLGRHGAEDLAKRSELTSWMTDKTPAWQFLLSTVSEYHAACHHIWHGVDPDHVLRDVDTAPTAARAHAAVIAAVDEHVGHFVELVGDATVVIGSHHGFQAADDLVSCVLLPELIHRLHHGFPALKDPDQASWKAAGMPPIQLDPDREWGASLRTQFTPSAKDVPRALFSRLPQSAYERARRLRGRPPHPRRHEFSPDLTPERDLDDPGVWQRAEDLGREVPHWYRRFWPGMRFFAIPSFDDGRIRVNLKGRERDGIVELADYEQTLADIEAFVRRIVDARTGEPLVREMLFERAHDPMAAAGPDADVLVRWDRSTDAIEHPDFGLLGPYPFLRSASHREEGWFAVRGAGATAGRSTEVLDPFQFSGIVDQLRRGTSYSEAHQKLTVAAKT